ncbi:MAG: hypothetical protein KAW16_05385 [candidate division Zixibacteria bacterium]|nr:hypothetical protein [candidate division Zixibacteria bacterium]MCK4427896.1 hypothetical protein [candidate division Zixibacteria bacterium]
MSRKSQREQKSGNPLLKAKSPYHYLSFLLFILLSSGTVSGNQNSFWEFSFKGYFKSLSSVSETFEHERYFLDLNRLRLQPTARHGENLVFRLELDNQFLLGDYLKTKEFKSIKKLPARTYLDIDKTVIDDENLYWKIIFYRAFLSYYSDWVDVSIGRQRFAWGTGKFFNPTDLLNPYNPTQIERQERVGTDALSLDFHLGTVTKSTIVYAPQSTWRNSSLAGRFKTTVKSYDLSFLFGKFGSRKTFGFDFYGYVGDEGMYAEGAYNWNENSSDFFSFVFGGEYTLPNGLYLNGEYFYNGGGKRKTKDYDWDRFFSAEILALSQDYLSLGLGYDITPLWRLENYTIINLKDQSLFTAPNVSYSVTSDLFLDFGIQFFMGAGQDEYGTPSNVYYLQLQYFF